MKGMAGRQKNILSYGSKCLSTGARTPLRRYLACFTLATMFLLWVSAIICDEEVYGMAKKKHVVLLGASVGHAWNIEALPERLKQAESVQDNSFEFVGDYQFDKTMTLKRLLARKENKPDAIIIKECAAYFPGEFEQYQALMKGWIKECKDAGVIPIPTTVVPVAKATSLKDIVKDLLKPLLGKASSTQRLEALLQYNDWIRAYTKQEGLALLDLEKTLRISETDRRLRGDLHSGDGLHLNAQAYGLLDQIVIPALDQAFSKK
jgi:hypothetical protein